MQKDVFDLIAASGPFTEFSEKLMVYGQFVGSWDIDATWYEQDGARRTGKGEWHIAWMQPAGGEFVHLVGRKVRDRIVQEGLSANPRRQERWTFSEITANSFLWTGEVSFDQGLTWVLEQEMRATRRMMAER